MARTRPPAPDHLAWKGTTVAGGPAVYGEAGADAGLPVVFLHGWGLAHHAYKRAMKRLVRLGCHVFAPALPGFGGTAPLPGDRFSFAGYADWLDAFLDVVGLDAVGLDEREIAESRDGGQVTPRAAGGRGRGGRRGGG